MSFGDELASALAELRELAESRMRARCIIERPGADETDEDGNVTTTFTQVYPDPAWPDGHRHADGKCELADFDSYPTVSDLAGATVVTNTPKLHLPFDAPDIRVGDRVTITHDPDTPSNIGQPLRVTGVRRKSMEKSRRLTVQDFQAPAGAS